MCYLVLSSLGHSIFVKTVLIKQLLKVTCRVLGITRLKYTFCWKVSHSNCFSMFQVVNENVAFNRIVLRLGNCCVVTIQKSHLSWKHTKIEMKGCKSYFWSYFDCNTCSIDVFYYKRTFPCRIWLVLCKGIIRLTETNW